MTNTRRSRRRAFWCRALFVPALIAGLSGCGDENDEPVPDAPGAFLLDQDWAYQATRIDHVAALPLPTDSEVLRQIDDPELPPGADALHGTLARFGADGRLLIRLPEAEDVEDFGARYAVVDVRVAELQLHYDAWYGYEYHFDRGSGALLFDSEAWGATSAGLRLLQFVDDLLTRTLIAGALDSAAMKLAKILEQDPRVRAAVEQLLFDWAHAGDPYSLAAVLVSSSGMKLVLDPEHPEIVLELVGVMRDLESVERSDLVQHFVDEVSESGVVDARIAPERVETLLRFLLYVHVMEREVVGSVERAEIQLQETN